MNGGEFNIENGVGVLCRGGQVYINGGTFTTTDPNGKLGKVGDSHVVVPCKTLFVDKYSNYSDYENAQIIVSGGKFSDDACKDYLADGYGMIKDGDWYKIVEATVATDEASLKSANTAGSAILVNQSIVLTDKNLSMEDGTSLYVAKDAVLSSEFTGSYFMTLSYMNKGGVICGEGTIVAPDKKMRSQMLFSLILEIRNL